MKIQATVFNFKAFMAAEGMTAEHVFYEGRKNMTIHNDNFTIFGEVTDKENGVMLAKDITVTREYMKVTGNDVLKAWDTYLKDFAPEGEPAEFTEKREREQVRLVAKSKRDAEFEELRAVKQAEREAKKAQREQELADQKAEREAKKAAAKVNEVETADGEASTDEEQAS